MCVIKERDLRHALAKACPRISAAALRAYANTPTLSRRLVESLRPPASRHPTTISPRGKVAPQLVQHADVVRRAAERRAPEVREPPAGDAAGATL
ncbi:hypothetical protein PsYK624_119140 [Phanerochaete sordida]|uniref:Uncharacterized protein n=1 Tax=Phanerochaete sordida TaxID=48140 RepID=A0A9P3LI46_9APHY|nr:hypothetical protein PsYK624_119140 [Phanerochaete sordida]